MFGFPRLRELIAEHAEEGFLGDFLMEELYSFVGEGWEQEDDITLVVVSAQGKGGAQDAAGGGASASRPCTVCSPAAAC